MASLLAQRIQFCNADAYELLQNGSDVLVHGRGTQPAVKHPKVVQPTPDCLFADTPFGWFLRMFHDVAWSKDYWQKLCVAAFKALSEEGVFVIRYGGWNPYQIYTALIDAGFTIRMKQPKIHVQSKSASCLWARCERTLPDHRGLQVQRPHQAAHQQHSLDAQQQVQLHRLYSHRHTSCALQ